MIFILFEELLWLGCGRLLRGVSKVAPIGAIENWIRRLPAVLALPLFVLPWLIMLPVKLGALWLIAIGKVTKGVLLFTFGEAFGVLFLARLYELCRPALHQWRWFVIVEGWLLGASQWAHRLLRSLAPVRWVEDSSVSLWTEFRRRMIVLRSRVKPPKL
jgi:hypothetical protein